MTLSEDLAWRELIKDKTFAELSWLDEPKTFYLGVDCSSDSMTIGNLAVIMIARRLLDAGWKTILLVGGATSLIGDPGGKDEERNLKSREEIQKNVAGISAQVERLFSGQEYIAVDNYDWFKDVGYLEFLRDVGKHYSMTELLQRDFIAQRIGEGGSGISYAEFSYSLIQGYDYWHLYKTHGAVLQIGGSDQWGNMLSGAPLIRKREGVEVHALSMPLVINKSTGKKFGKSEEGAVWLDANKTSVYKFYQFWLNVDDDSVIDLVKIYTLLDKNQIDDLQARFHGDKASRLAQRTLAFEVTSLVHGQDRAESVQRISETMFGTGDYSQLTKEDFELLKTELPVVDAKINETPLHEVLVSAGLASSNGEARRFLGDSAVYINGLQFSSEQITFIDQDNINGYAILRRGKNSSAVVAFR